MKPLKQALSVHEHHTLTPSQILTELLSSTLGCSLKSSVISRFKQLLATAWTKNGDSLSLFYSGTRALSFDGKANKVGGVNSLAITSSSKT